MKEILIWLLIFFILIFLWLGANSSLKENCEEKGGTTVTRGIEFTGCIEDGIK